MHEAPYHLGCPAWSIAAWRGRFLPEKTTTAEFLKAYSQVFNSVEGNSFFYALPKLDTVRRWVGEVEPGFQFCFKVPRDLSHAAQLQAASPVWEALLERLSIVKEGGALGPTFLQLHNSFSPARMNQLETFLDAWPAQFPLAVEVRHADFFRGTVAEEELSQRLSEHAVDRVIFDSRALFSQPPTDEDEERAQSRKPNPPVQLRAVGMRPMVRFVGRNNVDLVDAWLREVADAVAEWITEGKHPYVFMHTPDDAFAPELCDYFHKEMQKRIPDLPDLYRPLVRDQMELF